MVCSGLSASATHSPSSQAVSIAFRLLVCSGLLEGTAVVPATTIVSIAFRLLVCSGPDGSYDMNIARYAESQSPFGFWSVRDKEVPNELQLEMTVSIAFRLLVCSGHESVDVLIHTIAGLNCLSAFGLFGTSKMIGDPIGPTNCLNCLSAFGLFGTGPDVRRRVRLSEGSQLPFGFGSVRDSRQKIRRNSI